MQEVGTLYTVDVTAALSNLTKLQQQDQQYRAAVVQTGQAATGAFQQAAQQALAYQQQLAAAGAEVRGAAAVAAELRTELRRAAEAGKELEKATAAAGGASTAAGAKLNRELEQNRRKQVELKVEIELTRKAIDDERAAVARVRTEQQQQLAQQKLATAAAKDTAAATKQAAQAAKEAAAAGKDSGNGGFLGGLLGKVGPLAAGLFSISAIFGKIKEGIRDFADINSLNATFKALTGSIQGGREEVSFLRAESDRLGLDLVPTAQAYTGLFAAAKEANVPIAVTRELFQGLTSAGRVLGKSQSEVESAIRAVEQMISKGTVSSQELKLQLGNALPGAFSLAAKAIGVTTQELTKMLERGQIVSNEFLPKFARQLKESYGAGTEDAANSATANLGRINTFLKNQSAELGTLFAPLLQSVARLVSGTDTLAQRAEKTATSFFAQAEATRNLSQTLPELLRRYQELSVSAGDNKDKQAELRTVIDALAAAVPGAVTAFDKYGKALGINAKGIESFIEKNKQLTALTRGIALREGTENLKKLQDDQRKLQARLNSGVTIGGQRRLIQEGQTRIVGAAARVVKDPDRVMSQQESDAEFKALIQQAATVDAALQAQRQSLADIRAGARRNAQEANADTKARIGLINQLQRDIDALKKTREEADTTENDILRKGGLNDQIEAKQKELDRLQGKEETEKKRRARKGPDYLRQLLIEERKLRDEAAKIELQQLRDQGQARAAEQLRQSLAEIDRTEANLKRLERLAGRDGVIDGVQAQELGRMRLAARSVYTQQLLEIEEKHSADLFALRADSDQKELDAIERQYDEQVQKAQGQTDVLVAIEEARQRELLAVRQKQGKDQIERTAELKVNAVLSVGQVFGEGTGRSVIEAKKQEKEELLRIDLEKNEALLNNSLLLAGKEGEIVRSALRAQIATLKQGIAEVDREKKQMDPVGAVYRLILGENDSDENRARLDKAVGDSLNAISTLVQADLQAAQARIDARTRTIDDLNTRLSQEIELNKAGSASNIGNLKEQIAQEKAARREAVAERRKAAKEQIVIDTLLQSSSVVTAAAQALTAFPIPFVGPALGIAAASLIVGAFIASKVKAFQAVNSQSEGFYKGGYTGDGNPREESRAVGRKPYTYHKGEFVLDHKKTADYRHPLLEPLHAGRPQDIDWQHPKMQALLPDFTLPGKLRSEQRAVVEHRHAVTYAPLQAGLDGMKRELAEVRANTARLPTEQYVPQPDGSLLVIDLLTGNRVRYTQG